MEINPKPAPRISEDSLPAQIRVASFPWKILLVTIAIVSLVVFDLKGCSVLQAFETVRITHAFIEEVTKIKSTDGDMLEVATMEAEETFARSDDHRILWDCIDLGGTDSEIRVPATFRYHILLSDQWHFDVKDNVCIVVCPSFAPSLPTAIHSDRMIKESSGVWSWFNGTDHLDDLEKNITPVLDSRSGDQQHRDLVREQCRRSIEKFVRSILIKAELTGDSKIAAISVVFPDELNGHKLGAVDEAKEAFKLGQVP